jgi:hypothetical protein
MTNRKKVLQAAEEAGYKVKSLHFEREMDSICYWSLATECGKFFDSDRGDSNGEGIAIMIDEIKKGKCR